MFDALESRRLLAAGFQISLVFESSVSSSVQSVITQAANRWQQVITGDVPDVGTGAWGAAVDDIRITARVKAIDGPGTGVAQARPTYIRNTSKLPIAGEIEIDSADIASQTAAGTLLTIVTHEIGHALGFGTIWSQFPGLTSGLGGSNPLFLGTNALREYRTASGNSAATGVPLENTGATGTRDAHWRESILKTELMTGFLGAGSNPLSRITLGQFQDMGYVVNYNAADAFSLVTQTAGAITGTVFNDANRNGTKDSGEAGLSGRTVYVDSNWNNKYDAGEKTATSDASGNYTLSSMSAGSYSIRSVAPTGSTVTAPASGYHYVTVGSGQTVTAKHFGHAGTTTPPPTGTGVTGSVFNDANQNGTKDSGEAGLSGVTVYVDANWNNKYDAGERTVTTDASGNYSLTGLAAGGYSIRTVAPSGATITAPSSGYHYVSLAANQTLTGRNFGYRTGTTTPSAGVISGTVFKDTNRNGVKDAGEAGLSNYIIFIDADYDGIRDANEKYVTSSSTGAYSFTGLAAGGYSVRIVTNGATIVSPSSTFWWVTLSAGGSSTNRNYAVR